MRTLPLWLPPTQVTVSNQHTPFADNLEQGFLHAERPVDIEFQFPTIPV